MVVSGEAPVARKDQSSVGAPLLERLGRERVEVRNVLRYDGAPFRLGRGEDRRVRPATEVGPLRDRHDVVAPSSELDRDLRRPHLVQ